MKGGDYHEPGFKITDETTAILNRSTHEIELLQATYKLKNTLNQ